MNEEIKKYVLELLDGLIKRLDGIMDELTRINPIISRKVKIVNGEYTCSVNTLEDADYMCELFEKQQHLMFDLQVFPKVSTLKKTRKLIINNIIINDKIIDELYDAFSFKNDSYYADFFRNYFKIHNLLIIETQERAKIISDFEKKLRDLENCKLKNINNSSTQEVICDIDDVSLEPETTTVFQQEEIVISESSFSDLSKYYFELFISNDDYHFVYNICCKMITESNYSMLLEIKSYTSFKYNSLVKNPDDPFFIKCASLLMIISNAFSYTYDSDIIEVCDDNSSDLFFPHTDNGNLFIDSDLKDIPLEYYDGLSKLFYSLKTNNTNNGVVSKKITNNEALSNLLELKIFKLRLFYMLLPNDSKFIVLASLKKSNNDKALRAKIKNRLSNISDEYNSIKYSLSDLDGDDILYHQNIYDDIMNRLENKKNFRK